MAARSGISHEYARRLFAFEHTPGQNTTSSNVLIFIGGLGDGLFTVPYTTPLSQKLPSTWTLAQAILSSSYTGWGTSSLKKDVEELNKLVTYFRENGKTGKIILMGHSTGCQDVMEYLTGEGSQQRAKIDGAILQAGISDRDALVAMDPGLPEALDVAKGMIDAGNGEEIISSKYTFHIYGPTPVTARRFYSLAAKGGDDDYFSTDLSDEELQKTFGSIPAETGFCILFSGKDEYVAEDLDRVGLVEKWLKLAKNAGANVDEKNSGVVEGASHSLKKDPPSVVDDLIGRVNGFVKHLSGNQGRL